MHRLKYKQLLTFSKGKYHDGKGLYISIFKPRQRAEDNRRLVHQKIDPIDDKRRQKIIIGKISWLAINLSNYFFKVNT